MSAHLLGVQGRKEQQGHMLPLNASMHALRMKLNLEEEPFSVLVREMPDFSPM